VDYIAPPTNLVEFLVDLAGSVAGTLLSPRGMFVLFLSLAIGALRRPVWWLLPIALTMPLVLLNSLLPLWSLESVPRDKQFFESIYIVISYFTVSVLGYALGKALRVIKNHES
jgi:hypothetical protein